MTIKVELDRDGTVTITDTATGRSEKQSTAHLGRAAVTTVGKQANLPSHMFGRLS